MSQRYKVVLLGEGTSMLISAVISAAATQTPCADAAVPLPPPVVLAGRVGKTSILLRYIRGEYDDKQVSTLQASYLDKKITVNGKVSFVLRSWRPSHRRS